MLRNNKNANLLYRYVFTLRFLTYFFAKYNQTIASQNRNLFIISRYHIVPKVYDKQEPLFYGKKKLPS